MRDLFLLGILPVMLYAMFQRPFIALGMWLWTALFFPNGWVYGIASGLRFNLIFTAVAIVGYLALKRKPKVQFGALGFFVIVFLVWTAIGVTMTLRTPDVSWEYWTRLAKTVLLFVFVVLIVEKKLHVDFMLWCVLLSVGFYADLEGLKFIVSGGHHKIAGMNGHVLFDRNELAVAFVMTLPICYYLLHEYGKRSLIVRAGLFGTIALLVIAVVGTQSRGGFIALLALAGYMFIKSERKVLMGLLILGLGLAVMQLASNEWVERINTIEAADQDSSFMSRVVAWKLSFIMAVQNPFFGGSFKSLEYLPNWLALSQDFHAYPWFYSGDMVPGQHVARAAHSVYFQVLGEHGFVGLALYLAALGTAFFKASRIGRRARQLGAPGWLPLLASMIQLSIFSFALGGAALSFAYFDMIFALFGLVVALETHVLPAYVQAPASGQPALPSRQPLQPHTTTI